jgi:hypothetical protein
MCRADGRIFVLGCQTLGNLAEKMLGLRAAYNAACRAYCENHAVNFTFVDVNAIVPPHSLIDGSHFTREGYFALAKHILQIAAVPPADGCATLNAA